MNTDHPVTGGDRIAFLASDALVAALDRAAGREGCTRSHLARRIIGDALRASGELPAEAAVFTLNTRNRA